MNQALLQQLNPEQVQEDICLVELQAEAQGPESELDQMWSYVGKKANPRWLWQEDRPSQW